jgi:hypothetical protein
MALEIVTIFLAGAALGLRFKVMILVPALILTALFAAIVGLSSGDQFWSIAAAIFLLGTTHTSRISGWNPLSSQNRIGARAANGGHNVGIVAISRSFRADAALPTQKRYANNNAFNSIVASLQPLQIRPL